MLKTPIILLNFKLYSQALGKHALELAKVAEKVAHETNITIGVIPPLVELGRIAQSIDIPIFAQTAEPHPAGSHTGSVTLTSIKETGATGVLLNHSERPLKLIDIDAMIASAKKLNLLTVVCSNNPRVSKAAAVLDPTAVAFEPPELIGTGISVSTAQPEVVQEAVQQIQEGNPKVLPLCGAGVSTAEDVSQALRLGTKGVLLASAYVKAKNPYQLLLEMAIAAQKYA